MVKEERRRSKKTRRKSVCYLTYSTWQSYMHHSWCSDTGRASSRRWPSSWLDVPGVPRCYWSSYACSSASDRSEWVLVVCNYWHRAITLVHARARERVRSTLAGRRSSNCQVNSEVCSRTRFTMRRCWFTMGFTQIHQRITDSKSIQKMFIEREYCLTGFVHTRWCSLNERLVCGVVVVEDSCAACGNRRVKFRDVSGNSWSTMSTVLDGSRLVMFIELSLVFKMYQIIAGRS